MNLRDFNSLEVGLYIIYWKNGGSSLAAIGVDRSGNTWIAPVNWCGPMLPTDEAYVDHVGRIERAERIQDP